MSEQGLIQEKTFGEMERDAADIDDRLRLQSVTHNVEEGTFTVTWQCDCCKTVMDYYENHSRAVKAIGDLP